MPLLHPPARERVAAVDDEAGRILASYPPDRIRGKAESLKQIREALDAKAEVEGLLHAVQAYATESAGFTRSKVCFSDNWLRSGPWRAHVERIAKNREETKAMEARKCLIPWFDGVILSLDWQEAPWDKFVMAASRPRTRSERQYSDRKLRSRS